ncbi:dehydrogenase/reductase SDR family member FEY-like isoform X1 [Magnolia sinica]|uniref:dehydrogenase/reductase SDR family member FEY-like isoform X1 n=1 Tax=Magnolia sinica TaxID=86752 RepID=UPI002657E295|nr:dehydrogenase/reductase SDR family member FEY-like isoform X1 [Magnolia sinica]
MERKAWLRGVWEMVKEAFCQKLFTCHLPSSPHLLPDQFSSHSVIVTGATSGIGLHTAREVAMCGAHVTLACRNTKAAREIAHRWQQEAHASRVLHVEVMELDLLSLSSVRSFAAEWERRARPLHVLINNAGVFLMGEPQKFSDDGIEQHLQVNHVAPALLTLLLLPSLLRAPSSRIINVNSVAHHCAVVNPRQWESRIDEKKFSSIRAYGASKLAHLMFLKILASKLMDERKNCIQCIAVHPGIVTTNLVRTVPSFRRRSFWRFDPKEGARSVLFCVASADVAADLEKGFAYYSCNCKPARVSAQAADVDTCMEVWQKTLEIAGLNADYLTQVMDNASNPTLIYRELLGNTSIIV